MTVYSIGDQARAFALQASSYRLKTTLATLTDELSSGEVSDIARRLQGNTQVLSRMEARIAMTTQMARNSAEAAALTGAMQTALETVQPRAVEFGLALIAEPLDETASLPNLRSEEAAQLLEATISQFNVSAGGRYLFAGENSDTAPLVSGAEILDTLQVLTSGMATAEAVAQAVSNWFDAPPGGGGFVDMAYRGTIGTREVFAVAEGQNIAMATTAASPALRDVLKGLATAALAGRAGLFGQQHEKRALIYRGGQILVKNDPQLVGEMGRIGMTQQLIERAQTESAASLKTMETARSALKAADPYQTAGALQQVDTQLKTLYAVTARLSQLKLVDFLR